jgi:hypothetical protein
VNIARNQLGIRGQDLARWANRKIELGGNKSEAKVMVVKLEEATSGST